MDMETVSISIVNGSEKYIYIVNSAWAAETVPMLPMLSRPILKALLCNTYNLGSNQISTFICRFGPLRLNRSTASVDIIMIIPGIYLNVFEPGHRWKLYHQHFRHILWLFFFFVVPPFLFLFSFYWQSIPLECCTIRTMFIRNSIYKVFIDELHYV